MPSTLLDYFPKEFLLFVDESRVTLPQVRGMYGGDYARKKTLVEYGFRLPSAFDNRPLRFEEVESKLNQTIFVSATPGPYEQAHSTQVAEQVIRPTGLLDPPISVRPVEGQVTDLLGEIRARVERGGGPMVVLTFGGGRHGQTKTVQLNTVHLADQLMRVGLLEQGIELLTPVIPCCDPESETKLWCWVHRALAFYHFACGRVAVAHHVMATTLEACIRFDMPRPYYGFTWMFDMLGAFRMANFPDLPAYRYSHEIQAGLLSPSPLFRSAAIRVDTLVRVHEGMPWSAAEDPLRESLALAGKVGAPLDTARAQLALSRCLKHLGREDEAGSLYAAGAATLYRYNQYDCPLPKDSPVCRKITSIPCRKDCRRDFQHGAANLGDHDSQEKTIGAILDVQCPALHISRPRLVRTAQWKEMQVVGLLLHLGVMMSASRGAGR